MTENNNTNERRQNSSYKSRQFRLGGYSVLLTVIVIVAAVIINLIVGALPAKYTQIDVTGSDIYNISETSEQFISELDSDITIYYVTTEANRNYQLYTFLNKYAEKSSHIKLVQIDPEIDPSFSDEHGIQNENSLVVESALRTETVDYYDIYEYSADIQNEYYSRYYMYGYQIQDVYDPDVFDGDNELTSAIDYVTTENLPIVYTVTGHGEGELSTVITSYIDYSNIVSAPLNLVTTGVVPGDANVVIINNPTSDLTDDELASLTAYIDGGGKVILVTDVANYSTESMKNVTALAEHCGLTAYDGMVLEENTDYYAGTQYLVVPKLKSSVITAQIANPDSVSIVMNRAHAIAESETYEGGMTVSPVLVTSDTAYIIGATEEVRSRTDDDKSGQFYLGAIASDAQSGGMFVWYSSEFINSELSYRYVNYNNLYVFLYTVTEICEKPTTISVDSISIGAGESLTLTQTDVTVWTVIIQYLIPLAVLVPGVIVWILRRKR